MAAGLGLSLGAACVGTTKGSNDDDTGDGGRSGSGGSGSDTDGGTGGSGGSGGGDGGTGGGDGGTGGTADPDGGSDGGGDATPGSITLSGQLRVGATLFVDSDTRDTENPFIENDELTESGSQAIGNPSTVGGFIGSEHFPSDVFRVTLGQDEIVTLYIRTPSDPSADLPDFDLYLYDSDGDLVAGSAGTGPVEMVTAPSSGTFYVEVLSYFDPDAPTPTWESGMYTLTVGQKPSAAVTALAARERLNPLAPMIAGEAIIRPRVGGQLASKRAIEQSLGVRVLSGGSNVLGSYRVALPTPKRLQGGGAAHTGHSTIAAIKSLRRSGQLVYAEPNYLREAHAPAPNDDLYANQWHYPLINLTDAWDHSQGAGVIVAVLDTGVVLDHPDFKNGGTSRLVPGYDMISVPSIAGDGNGRDSDPNDPGDQRFPSGASSWHGTHVAGTVAAATNNDIGCAGVAPEAKIMPVRVLGRGGGTQDDIAQGILYAAGLANDTGQLPAQRADIINMSLGGEGASAQMEDAIIAARNAGVIVVVSSGNHNTNAAFFSPAGVPEAVTVGAVDIEKKRAYYSNWGSVVDVVGPGGDESRDRNFDGVPDGVMSLVYANGGNTLYAPYQGTSMSAPHVAGIAALMKSAFPAMTPNDFDALIAGTFPDVDRITEDLGPTGKDQDFGHGLLNANLAVLGALAAADTPAQQVAAISVNPQNLDFGAATDSLTFTIMSSGTAPLNLTSVTTSAPWITVTPSGGTVGTNTITVDRSGLSAGIHTGVVTIQSNGGTEEVRVRASVGAVAVTGGDIGHVYVVLVDAETGETVAGQAVTAADEYEFSLEDVPPGTYYLAAGTDLDLDDYIDSDGDAFGAYPLSTDPQLLEVTESLSGLDFTVQFGLSVQGASTAPAPRPRVRRLR